MKAVVSSYSVSVIINVNESIQMLLHIFFFASKSL